MWADIIGRTFCTVTNLCKSPGTVFKTHLDSGQCGSTPDSSCACKPHSALETVVWLEISVKIGASVSIIFFPALSFWNRNWKPGQNSELLKTGSLSSFKPFSWRELIEEIICFFSSVDFQLQDSSHFPGSDPRHLSVTRARPQPIFGFCIWTPSAALKLLTEGGFTNDSKARKL